MLNSKRRRALRYFGEHKKVFHHDTNKEAATTTNDAKIWSRFLDPMLLS
jgi:hypothetical protein